MIEFYSMTSGLPLPLVRYDKLPESSVTEESIVIRMAYEDGQAISILYTRNPTISPTNLSLTGASGYSSIFTTDSRHHHVQRLTNNVEEYAAALRCSSFIVSTDRGEEWILNRLPEWTQIEDAREGYTTLMLEV